MSRRLLAPSGTRWIEALLGYLVIASCHSGDHTRPLGPSQLAFIITPSSTTAGAAIKPAVMVAIQDVEGNTVTDATDAVSLTLGSNPGGAVLSGTTTVRAVDGVAVFSDLSIDKPATQYTRLPAGM